MTIYQTQTNYEFGALAINEREVCGTYCNIGSNPLAPDFNNQSNVMENITNSLVPIARSSPSELPWCIQSDVSLTTFTAANFASLN